MDFSLSPDQLALRENIIRFARHVAAGVQSSASPMSR